MSIKSAAARPLMLLSALAFISISFISFGKPAMAASTGAITNANGMCLDNKNNSSTNNNLVQLWTCTGGASQQWTVQGDGTIRINGKCLDTVNHSTSMGTQLAIFTCGSYSTQKWTYAATGFAKLQSQAQNKFCADNDNNRAVNGNKVTNYGCWNTPAQQWRMPQAVAATPPTVSLTAPAISTSVSGVVTVSANASDAVAVSNVQFKVDGINIGTADTTSPYSVSWDTATATNGQHALTAVATNSSNLSTTSASVTVTVENTIPGGGTPTSPSGQDVPVGDLTGWKQTFIDDFTLNAPTGSWGTTDSEATVYTGDHGGKWTVYPDGWSSTYTNGQPGYQPGQVLSVHDGVLDFNLHSVNNRPSGANPSPLVTGTSRYQTYGRYDARIKSDTIGNYHAAWLLWPELDANGGCAESDFPEGNLNSTVSAFAHNATNCSQYSVQDAFNTSTRFDSGWHTYTQEWGPNFRKYYVDGNLIGTSTTRVWNKPARWQLQVEPSSNTGTTSGHFLVDWVTAYSYNP